MWFCLRFKAPCDTLKERLNAMNSEPLNLDIDPAVDHIQGQLDAPIVLLEYGDFECPFCGEAHVVVKNLQSAFGERLCFVYRHFPLIELHPHAEMAAEAAEAAAVQGRFWEMHDMLFENQDALEKRDLVAYALEIGLDDERFLEDLDSGVVQSRVQRDIVSGLSFEVSGTPTFFINGVRYVGSSRELGEALHALS